MFFSWIVILVLSQEENYLRKWLKRLKLIEDVRHVRHHSTCEDRIYLRR